MTVAGCYTIKIIYNTNCTETVEFETNLCQMLTKGPRNNGLKLLGHEVHYSSFPTKVYVPNYQLQQCIIPRAFIPA